MKLHLVVLLLLAFFSGSAWAGGSKVTKMLESVKGTEDADAPPKKPVKDTPKDDHSRDIRTGIDWSLIANKLQFIGNGYFPIEFDNQQRQQLLQDISMPLVARKKTAAKAKVSPPKKKKETTDTVRIEDEAVEEDEVEITKPTATKKKTLPKPTVRKDTGRVTIDEEEDTVETPATEEVSEGSILDCLTKHYNMEAHTDYKHYLSHSNFEMSMNLKGEGKFVPNVDLKMGGKAGVGASVYAATLRRSWNHEVNLFTVYIDPKCYGRLASPFKSKLEEMKELEFTEETAPLFYAFFYEFGTHFSRGAQVGGMVSIEESEALKGFEFSQELAATASNQAMTVEVGDKLKTNKFKSARHASVHVIGGTSQDVMVQAAETSLRRDEVTKEYMSNLKDWQTSITPETAVVTSYTLSSILELIDADEYPKLKREMKKAWDKYAKLVEQHARKIESMRPIGVLLRKYVNKLERNPSWFIRVFVRHLRRDVLKHKLLFEVLSGFCHVYGCEVPWITSALDLNRKMQLTHSHFRTMLTNFEKDLDTARGILLQYFGEDVVRYRDQIPGTTEIATTYEWVEKPLDEHDLRIALKTEEIVEQIQKRWNGHKNGRTLGGLKDEFMPEDLDELDSESLAFEPPAVTLYKPSRKIADVVAAEVTSEPDEEPTPESDRISDKATKEVVKSVKIEDEEDEE